MRKSGKRYTRREFIFKPPHMKAPGKPHPGFTAYAWFNAGLQIFDISNPKDPKKWSIPGLNVGHP